MKPIKSISGICQLLDLYANQKGLIFRGQCNSDWKLEPIIFRNTKPKVVDLHSHVERFKKYLIGKVENLDSLSNYEIWSIGQHHGLKTPFLDWSVSPAVALYFAFSDNNPDAGKYRTISVLKAERINELYCKALHDKMAKINRGIANHSNFSDAIAGRSILNWYDLAIKHNNSIEANIRDGFNAMDKEFVRCFSPKTFCSERIIAQRGLFTFSTCPDPLDEILAKAYEPDLVTTHLINSSLRGKILEFLDSININHLTMYPDINGAAMYANNKIALVNPGDPMPSNARFWL